MKRTGSIAGFIAGLIAALCALGSVAEARPTDAAGGDLWRFDAADSVESYDTARFRIFYTRAGKNAVPTADANVDGVPDHVAEVGQLYESVLDFYLGRGFLAPLSDAMLPNNGGDGRFNVYLLDFAKAADGAFSRQQCDGNHACIGYMVQENDFAGYAYPSATIGNRVLASHEFFHAVQAAYNADQDSALAEGSAVWATEQFDASLSDLEGFVPAYFKEPGRSIDKPPIGPVQPFAYGAAIFFQFLSEKLDVAVVRELYEDCVPGARGVDEPSWLPALAALLPREHQTSFGAVFAEFATWNLFTRGRSDPARGYENGAAYPLLTTRMMALPYEDPTLRVFHAASEVLQLEVGGRAQLVVEILPAAGLGADSLANLRIVVAPIVGSKIGTVSTRLATEQGAPIDLTGAGQVIVELVNGAVEGESTRGILCIGDPTEAAACRAKHAPPVEMPPAEEGCAFAGRPTEAPIWAFLFLAALALRAFLRPRRGAGSFLPC